MENKKEYGIFENVQFLDEGVGAVIFGLLALPYILIGTVLVAAHIGNKIDESKYKSNQKKINKAIIRLEKRDKHVADFKKNIGSIRRVDATYLLKAIGKTVGEKETNTLKNASTCCAAIFDKNDNIIAYAMHDLDHGKCAYNILDSKYRSNENVKLYIMAKLDNNLEIISEGIKLLKLKLKKTRLDHSKNFDGFNQAFIVSKEEYKDHCNVYDSLLKKLKSYIAKSSSTIRLMDEDKESEFWTNIYYEDGNIADAAEYDEYEEAWDRYYHGFATALDSAVSEFKNKYKTELDKHGFKIEVDDNPDDDGIFVSFYHGKGFKPE